MKQAIKQAVGGLLLLVTLGWLPCLAWAKEDKIVMFSAIWCASCRELLPAVKGLSSKYEIPFFLIDVDKQIAPNEARKHGLNIPHKELPQAYLIQSSHSTLLFDGENYQLGQRRFAEQTMERRIQGQLKE